MTIDELRSYDPALIHRKVLWGFSEPFETVEKIANDIGFRIAQDAKGRYSIAPEYDKRLSIRASVAKSEIRRVVMGLLIAWQNGREVKHVHDRG